MNRISTNFISLLLAIPCFLIGCKDDGKLPTGGTEPFTHKPSTPITAEMSSLSDTAGDIYTKAALATCNCVRPVIEQALLLKKYTENRQAAEAKKITDEMAEMHPRIQKCSDEISQKYSRRIKSSIEKEKLLKALTAQCPNAEIIFSYLEKRPRS